MNIILITLIGVVGGVALCAWACVIIKRESEWFRCSECGIFHNTAGQYQFNVDEDVHAHAPARQCDDCYRRQILRAAKLLIVLIFSGVSSFAGEPSLDSRQRGEIRSGNVNRASSGGNFIDRIALIESGMDSTIIGDNGKARGSWQMTEAAWMDVNALRRRQQLPEYPWEVAHDDGMAREYALQYCGILNRQLRAALRRHPSEPEILSAWQLGYAGFKKRGFSVPKSIQKKISPASVN